MTGNPGSYFGKQVKKERLARGWGLDELARVTGIDGGHWSRIENGKRPPTAKIAGACDKAFPERGDWFIEYYFELQSWSEVPSWFKPWSEFEMTTATVRSWSPLVVNGLLQTEDYASAQTALHPGITKERLAEWVANRMARQKRVLFRDDPPRCLFLVDISSLRRMLASIRDGQLRHLLEVAALPHVVIQVVPEVWHGGMSGGFVLTDNAAFAESVATGQVYGGSDETVGSLSQRFDSLRTEAMSASESLAMIREMLAREGLAKVNLLRRRKQRLCRAGQ